MNEKKRVERKVISFKLLFETCSPLHVLHVKTQGKRGKYIQSLNNYSVFFSRHDGVQLYEIPLSMLIGRRQQSKGNIEFTRSLPA